MSLNLADSIEKFENQAFALYRLPGESKVNLIAQRNDDFEPTDSQPLSQTLAAGFYCIPFSNRSASTPFRIRPDRQRSFRVEKLREHIQVDSELLQRTVPSLPTDHSPVNASDRFTRFVEQIQRGIAESPLEKVIASRFKDLPLSSDFDPIDFYRKLCLTYPTAFCYFWHHPKFGTWAGATPETLLVQRGEEYQTMALAGTRKIEASIDTVEWGQKEIDEQYFVQKRLEAVFDELDLRYQKLPTRTQAAGSVAHLKTDYIIKVNTLIDLPLLLKKIHPTPAVGGLPVGSAADFIDRYEGYDRRYYAGYLGPIGLVSAETALFVNLRCCELFADRVRLYIGAGITAESDPQAEWQETEWKAQTISSLMAQNHDRLAGPKHTTNKVKG